MGSRVSRALNRCMLVQAGCEPGAARPAAGELEEQCFLFVDVHVKLRPFKARNTSMAAWATPR